MLTKCVVTEVDTGVAIPLLMSHRQHPVVTKWAAGRTLGLCGHARRCNRCGEFARRGIAGVATHDGLIALAAREHGVVLATRDARARSTYETFGVETEVSLTEADVDVQDEG